MQYQIYLQRIKSPILFSVLIIAFLLPGCNKDDDSSVKVETEIGVLLPLTGAAGSVSESSQLAAGMALQDVNDYFENTNAGIEIQLTIEDTETDPDQAMEALMKLHEQGITTVIGPYTSGNAAGVLDYANANNITLLSPASVATSLSIEDHLYRLVPNNSKQSKVLSALFIHDRIEALVPVVRDDIWGNGLIENMEEDLDPGIVMLDVIHYDPSSPDAGSVGDKIQTALDQATGQFTPEHTGVLLLTYDEGTEILEAASQKISTTGTQWYGSSAYANNTALLHNEGAAGFALNHGFTCSAFGPDPDNLNQWAPVRSALTDTLGHIPDVYSLNMYDAVWLMAFAWEKSIKSSSKVDFRITLEETAMDYKGITGYLAFDEFGDRKNWSFDFWGLTNENGLPDWNMTGFYKDGILEINR